MTNQPHPGTEAAGVVTTHAVADAKPEAAGPVPAERLMLEPWIDPEDELICLGHGEDLQKQGGALAPPVVQTSLFAQDNFDAVIGSLNDEFRARVYSRGNNPTVQAVEQKIAALERTEACRCFGSGMGAVHGVLSGTLSAGDHILFVGQTYGPTMNLARKLQRFDVEHSLVVDVTQENVDAALVPNTKLVWMESPSTMAFQTFDIGAVVEAAKAHSEVHSTRVLTALDNSWASPLFQKPALSGVDFVVHSATKYIGGHSDVVAGAVACSEELMEPLFHDAFLLGGAALAPWDAWLLNRGLRTLPVRMRQHHRGALAVAEYLGTRKEVARVLHPGIGQDAIALAREPGALSGFSGLFSFELALDHIGQTAEREEEGKRAFDQVRRFLDALERFRIGVSWGGVESLALAPARLGNASALAAQGIAYGTVRLSIGLEPPQILCDDLDRAFSQMVR